MFDFPHAKCTIKLLEDDTRDPPRAHYIPFVDLFEVGVRLLEKIINSNGVVPDDTEDLEREALQQLNEFFENKGRKKSYLTFKVARSLVSL